MNAVPSCPALMIAGLASGQGKTTVTAGLARYHARQGRRVAAFKVGPDFIDPSFLHAASGGTVHNLDLWMVGEAGCARLLAQAAGTHDLILIEGAMGLFDGQPSASDLAERFGIPVLAVVDASAMAQTFGAVVHGLMRYRPSLPLWAVVANRVAGPGHADWLTRGFDPIRAADPARRLPHFGWLARQPHSWPERHLGLQLAQELDQIVAQIDTLADAVAALPGAALLPPALALPAPPTEAPPPPRLQGATVAVAQDAAFAFVYAANLSCLQALGARIRTYSPLAGERVPAADAIYLPGGYPELYAGRLGGSAPWLNDLRQAAARGVPIVAECGGMMVLFDELVDLQGNPHRMAGLLPGRTVMSESLQGIGLQQCDLGSIVEAVGASTPVRGHSFHYGTVQTELEPTVHAARHPGGARGEPVYRRGSITASFFHAYFPSNPSAVGALFLRK